MMRFLLAALFAGCAGETEYTPRPSGGEESTEGSNNQDISLTADADGDGFTVEDGDCDDEDPDAYPGAEETWYDEVVQNCDLLIGNEFPEGWEWLVESDKDGDLDVYGVHGLPDGIYLDPDDEDPNVGHEDGHSTGNADQYWENQDTG